MCEWGASEKKKRAWSSAIMSLSNRRTLLHHRSPAPRSASGDSSAAKRNAKVTLDEVSYPPTHEELRNYEDMPLSSLPPTYKRKDLDRVFCNRNLAFSNISHIGFDMDYTICAYTSALDGLAYDLTLERLVASGYPSEISSFKFDPEFPVRGLFVDKKYGNLIKVDGFGNIMLVLHGRRKLSDAEVEDLYPNNYVAPAEVESKRYYVVNTLFGVPEVNLLADLVEFFESNKHYKRLEDGTGVSCGSQHLTYHCIFTDVRNSVDFIHNGGNLKQFIVADLAKYVVKDERAPALFERILKAGKKAFLVTNSDYHYTQMIMSYLFDVPPAPGEQQKQWTDYFDLIVVSACKPTFFEEGTLLREVDLKTGSLKIGEFVGAEVKGRVLAGGSSEQVDDFLKTRGSDILYVGDHIFGDVLKSKKLRAWRTMLVVPELKRELEVCRDCKHLYSHLKNLEFMLAEVFRGMDSNACGSPPVNDLKQQIESTAKEMDRKHNAYFGSLFRSGMRQTFFAMQTKRYADLYAPSYLNLINYPFCYEYRCDDIGMPHEEIMAAAHVCDEQ
eukprot:m.185877 g.185877  ORF g.185877 m.185877 type:complete len:556 (+) comp21588_c0_seq6:13-1680(+)